MKQSFDSFAALQRDAQLKQAQAANNSNVVLVRVVDKLSGWLYGIGLVLLVPTLFISSILMIAGLATMYARDKVYVKDVASGEKFWLSKEDWNKYKANKKNRNKNVRSLDEISKNK